MNDGGREQGSGEVGLEYLDHLTFGNDDFDYGGTRYRYSDISKLKYSAAVTKHRVNFVPTGTSYEVDFRLIFDDGKMLAIKPEKSFFGARSKERHEAVMRAASIFSNITFNQRLRNYEQALAKKNFVEWGSFQIHRNGDLFRNGELKLNIKDPTARCSLGVFHVNFSKERSGILNSLKNAFISSNEVVDLTVDKDCFLYIMKHWFGRTWIDTPVPEKAKARKELFSEALLILGAKLCKSDGIVSPEEVAFFQEYFGIDETVVPRFREVFHHSANDGRSAASVAGSMYEMLAANREALEFILAGLIQIAASDGVIHDREIRFVRVVASEFHFSNMEVDQLLAIFQHASTNQSSGEREEGKHEPTALVYHLKVLGLKGDVEFKKVKETYRELVRRHHPDILRSQGIALDKVRAAEQLLMAINVSYEWLEGYHKQAN